MLTKNQNNQEMNTEAKETFRCIVKTCNLKEFNKTNGSIYILQNVEIIDGALQGATVVAERTIYSAYSDNENEPIPVGEEAIVYMTALPRLDDPTKMKYFFQLANVTNNTTDDEISNMLAKKIVEEQKEQKI